MSLPLPLAVRLSTSRNPSRHITREVRDLVFRWTDPGGYQSCTVALDRPLTLQPDEIAYYGHLTVYDTRSGQVVFDGRQEDPGRSAGAGQIWDLTAMGGRAHTEDRTVPLIYVDREAQFERVDNTTPNGTDSRAEDPGGSGKDSIVLQFPQGLSITTGSRVAVRYIRMHRAGMKLARVDYTWDAGSITTNQVIEGIARTDGSLASGDTFRSQTLTTAGGGSSPKVVGDWTAGRNSVDLRHYRTGGAATAGDNAWVSLMDWVVLAMRYDKSGVELTSGYTTNYVLAHQVVEDLLGRLLTAYDGAGATVDVTTHQIQQLAYPDGVTPHKVLSDLMALESGYTWRVWERNSAGKYRFEWTAVPSTVRYEATVEDGYDSQGSADGLYNRVTVRWRDSGGHIRTTERTATVPELDAAGLIRQGLVDLGDEIGSTADAQRAGDQWLADHRYAANAGRLRIARPILDLQTGRMVMPWEIRPGLIRVRGVLPRIDALNATARDGVTIFRIVACEFRASDGAATLELDSYVPSTQRQVSELLRRPVHRRR